jgi:stage V sporulation protein G
VSTKPVIKVERIEQLSGEGPTKAFVDLLILDTFVVKGLRIVEGGDGLFTSMPREQGRDGKWYDTFYPVNEEMRKGLEELILEEYASNKNNEWDGETNGNEV